MRLSMCTLLLDHPLLFIQGHHFTFHDIIFLFLHIIIIIVIIIIIRSIVYGNHRSDVRVMMMVHGR